MISGVTGALIGGGGGGGGYDFRYSVENLHFHISVIGLRRDSTDDFIGGNHFLSIYFFL